MKKLIIISIGDTFSDLAKSYGDFEHWIQAGTGHPSNAVLVIDPRKESDMPELGDIAGVVISSSRVMVTDRHRWSEALKWPYSVLAQGRRMAGPAWSTKRSHQRSSTLQGRQAVR